ncbi:MFS transporter [Streptomyces capparidis]
MPPSLTPYRTLFSAPGAVAFTLAGAVARLPTSMLGVGNVVMIATVRDSYALAGAVSAAGVVAAALASPFLGRLVDRHGQSRVALPAAAVFAAGAAAMLLCVTLDAPTWALFVCAAASAATPSVGAMTRARWEWVHRERPAARPTANSFEQVMDELCFVLGPALAMLLCTAAFPQAGLLTAAVLLVVGTALFSAQRRTEPPPRVRDERPALLVRRPGLPPLLAAFGLVGAVFGGLEVATLARTDALGSPAAGGVLLAVQAAGSCAAGLVLGALPQRAPAPFRFTASVAALAAAVAGLLLAGSLPVLCVLLLLVGVATAPTMVTGMTLAQDVIPGDRLNEGLTTLYTALLVGISAGAATGGWCAEHLGSGAAYAPAAVAAALAAVAARAVGRAARPPAEAAAPDAPATADDRP